MPLNLTFLGAAGTVTGSRFLLDDGQTRVLVDCGLFQGHKVLRKRNRAPLGTPVRGLDAVVLTHAHLDHSGYVPALLEQGYPGRVHVTGSTADLCGVLWPDSGHLQEEDARYANRKGFSRHAPALPLYTEEDAIAALERLEVHGWDQPYRVGAFELRHLPAGHILGASMVRVVHPEGTVLFSGDLGRPDDLVMRAPTPLPGCDLLVMESTYGDRLHGEDDPVEQLFEAADRVLGRGGSLLVPAFAVGRAQAVLHAFASLIDEGRLPAVPLYLNSPMATRVTELYRSHLGEHRLTEADCRRFDRRVQWVSTVDQSKALVADKGRKIVVSASGMATGGRVLHHLKAMAPHRNNGILLVGYQAAGTRGAQLRNGAAFVRIHGCEIPVEAEVLTVDGLSAHADAQDLRDWVNKNPPPRIVLVHGEPEASDTLRRALCDDGLDCDVADHLETIRV